MTWHDLGDVINRFRQRCLGLELIILAWAPGMANRLIEVALHPSVSEKANGLGVLVRDERGCENGASSFHANLPTLDLRCSLLQRRSAVWKVRGSDLKTRALATTILIKEGLLGLHSLELSVSEYPST